MSRCAGGTWRAVAGSRRARSAARTSCVGASWIHSPIATRTGAGEHRRRAHRQDRRQRVADPAGAGRTGTTKLRQVELALNPLFCRSFVLTCTPDTPTALKMGPSPSRAYSGQDTVQAPPYHFE